MLIAAGCTAFSQTNDAPAMPPSNSLVTVRRALREFDRFLDHHPLLEDELRLKPALATDQAYLKTNPELGGFLRANQDIFSGLKLYPRYFLYRALLRQASAPLRYSEIAQLKNVLDAEPALELALTENPESIRDIDLLAAHVPLRDFLMRHPLLAEGFHPNCAPAAKAH